MEGNCHHLALAALEAAGQTGQLPAGRRLFVNADTGEVETRNGSHMIGLPWAGTCGDIDGPEADTRWDAQVDHLVDPDANRRLSGFAWRPPRRKVPAFVSERDACFDRAMVDAIKANISVASRPPAMQ